MIVFAIDPGSSQSAYCLMQGDAEPLKFGKVENGFLIGVLRELGKFADTAVIERVASYGMPVGREVFDTCEWIGRYTQVASDLGLPVEYILRQEEKLAICKSTKANDATIRKALIDRFAKHDLKNGKGTKANPDFFYGFKADCWMAFATGIAWLCKKGRIVV